MSGIVIVLEWSSFPDLENRQLASREHKVGIKRNITRHEKNKDLPSLIYMKLSEIVEKENWGSRFVPQIIFLKCRLCFSLPKFHEKYIHCKAFSLIKWQNVVALPFLSFDVE